VPAFQKVFPPKFSTHLFFSTQIFPGQQGMSEKSGIAGNHNHET